MRELLIAWSPAWVPLLVMWVSLLVPERVDEWDG